MAFDSINALFVALVGASSIWALARMGTGDNQ